MQRRTLSISSKVKGTARAARDTPSDTSSGSEACDRSAAVGTLVLTRHPKQSIVIDGNIIIRVLAVNGDFVSLGFDAPRDRVIFREEVYQRIQAEKKGERQMIEDIL